MIDPALHVEEHPGAPDAPVVVLVHGVFDSCESFDGVIEHLVPDHTVLTYDRRGWGRSADATPTTCCRCWVTAAPPWWGTATAAPCRCSRRCGPRTESQRSGSSSRRCSGS